MNDDFITITEIVNDIVTRNMTRSSDLGRGVATDEQPIPMILRIRYCR